MRTLVTLALALVSTVASADTATPQTCLGDVHKLACPAGSKQWGTECRAAGDHWSGSKRQGPSVFLRDDNELDPVKLRVWFAASYRDHKKTGRVFHFDKD